MMSSPSSWSRVFAATTLAWTAALLVAGLINAAQVPGWGMVTMTAQVVAVAMGILALLGWLGLSMSFAGAQLGLAFGYVWMLWSFATAGDGMADLAAFAAFLACGAIGLGVGLLVDGVRFVVRRLR